MVSFDFSWSISIDLQPVLTLGSGFISDQLHSVMDLAFFTCDLLDAANYGPLSNSTGRSSLWLWFLQRLIFAHGTTAPNQTVYHFQIPPQEFHLPHGLSWLLEVNIHGLLRFVLFSTQLPWDATSSEQ
eukprot:Gb_10425 [translate_table: standard]